MSSSSLVAKRYANALFQVAKEKNVVAKIGQELQLVANATKVESSFIELLTHPSLATERKHQLIQDAFGKAISELTLNTLLLLSDRRRADVIADLSLYYSRIASKELGQIEALVTSAKQIDDEELKKVQKQFSEILGKEVRLTQNVNEELIGGIQVRIGDTLYDGSIAGKLARLEKSLQQSQAL